MQGENIFSSNTVPLLVLCFHTFAVVAFGISSSPQTLLALRIFSSFVN